jgi:siderophore synthetase component
MSAWLADLDRATWDRANRELLAKLVTEWTFEDILEPERDPEPDPGVVGTRGDESTAAPAPGSGVDRGGHGDSCDEDGDAVPFRLAVGDDGVLRYRARRRSLGHWRVDPHSLRWTVAGGDGGGDGAAASDDGGGDGAAASDDGGGDGAVAADDGARLPDVTDLVARLAPAVGVTAPTVAGLVHELSNTLLADVHQLRHGRPAAELAGLVETADPGVVEAEVRGHPWIVANKGRLGFDAADLAAYAPESDQPVRLLWLAAAPGRAESAAVAGLDHATVVAEQVGEETWTELRTAASAAGLDPDTATYVPVHPWQWRQRIVPLHAADLARGDLVVLGEAPQRYRPQQSLRTMADVDHPERRYLKLPLSILNTSVYRGLPRRRTLAAPALSEWFAGLVEGDPFLKGSGLVLLGEVAGVSVAHAGFEAIAGVPYQHTEMLGAIWRESVAGKLAEGEHAVTLAALLHRDPAGVPLLDPLVARSGLTVADWVDRFHEVTLPPLAHVLYRYGASFSPHGQNCLLALQDGVPARLVVKDFVDDVVVSPDPLPELATLPADVQATLAEDVEPILAKYIHGALLVCVHRYLAELLDDHFGHAEAEFWASARRALRRYQDGFAELADRYALFELDAPRFKKLCLNRLRLYDRGYADDPERPVVTSSGWIDNPLAHP